MHAHGVDIGAVDQGLVGGRVIALDPFDQLVLSEETERLGLLRRLGFGVDFRLGRRGRRRSSGELRPDRCGGFRVRLYGKRFCARGAQ
jgi:hypothetical protein